MRVYVRNNHLLALSQNRQNFTDKVWMVSFLVKLIICFVLLERYEHLHLSVLIVTAIKDKLTA